MRRVPGLQACRDMLTIREPYGIWGGMDEDGRIAARRRLGVA